MGFPAPFSVDGKRLAAFQSLVGVYGFSRQLGFTGKSHLKVSIPSRGLWVFPPDFESSHTEIMAFQSLVGVYGFSRMADRRS